MTRVVVVGGGFAGLTAARGLAGADVQVTLVDRRNHHLFQPLLYQVAMAGLSPAEIAMPIRSVLRGQANATVLLAAVTRVDLPARRVHLEGGEALPYDHLVLAAGSRTSYFGNDGWAVHALGLKDLEDALEIRRRVLAAFEEAERSDDAAERERLLTFVVVGGGPTGAELAGALAELARHVLARDFRRIDPRAARVILVESGDEILSSFGPRLAAAGRRQLEALGVQVRTGKRVTGIDAGGVTLGDEAIAAATVLWGAGVRGSELAEGLGVPLDRGGRVIVLPDCSIPGHPEAFVVGDMASFSPPGQGPLPGLAPIAIQQARAVAAVIARRTPLDSRPAFRYRDRGTMATIGRSRAVARTMGLELSGTPAWLAWLVVHIVHLIGFRNRLLVLFDWFWSYVTYGRGARLITRPGSPEP